MSKLIAALVALGALAPAPAAPQALTADQIIDRLEKNLVFDTARLTGTLVVRDRFGERESTFVSWSRGEDTALIEFTSAEERGMKILRTRDEIYLYYPDATELIRLQGAALRDAVLGSDMSYEDLTGGKGLLKSYRATLEGTEAVDGRPCYRVSLEALRRDVAYYRQVLWVDSSLFLPRRIHKLARSGALLKEVEVDEIRSIAGRNVITRMTLRDTLKRGSSTSFVMSRIEIDIKLPPTIFSLGELTW
jgi:outer membrane lipoprotein-sorting protein